MFWTVSNKLEQHGLFQKPHPNKTRTQPFYVGNARLCLGCKDDREKQMFALTILPGCRQAGWTCLFYATYHNEANIVQYLLMHGADPELKDKRGLTAVDWGEHMGFGETCAIFSSFEYQLAP